MGRSSVGRPASTTVLRTVRPDGTPVYRYREEPGVPPVNLVLLDASVEPVLAERDHRHAHDFHILMYVERGGGAVRVGDREVVLSEGTLRAVPPGEVVRAEAIHDLIDARVWSVAFAPDAVPALAGVSPLAWEHHPLLALFADGGAGAQVAEGDRERWAAWLTELGDELSKPTHLGAREVVSALLTRILVASARLAPTPSAALDPLIEQVFEVIEAGFRTPMTASDVARAVGYTPGHLTTTLRRRTGRTLLDWIAERRLTEVRLLLRDTDLPLGVIAARTGLGDAGYLVRRFRRRYGVTPERWRRGHRLDAVVSS